MSTARAEIEARQLAALNEPGSGLELLRERNAFYRHKLSKLALPLRSLEAFRELDLTTKSELVEDQLAAPPYGTNLTFERERYTRIHATSGTTGRRLKCLDTNESWDWFLRCWEEIYRAIGVGPSDRVFAAFGFGPFVGFWAGFEAAQRLGALAIPAGAQSSRQRLDWLVDSEATVLLSTPTYALRLAEVARDVGVDLRSSSVTTTIHAGEPGASIPATRERIESAWGARAWDHAGMSEVGPWGYECPERQGMHVLEDDFIAEVLELGSDRPVVEGETGELVLTNLGRWAMPALRYRTGDLVRQAAGPCACASAYARYDGGVLGRADDMVQVRGVNVYPSAVEAIVREQDGVREFQVEVVKRGELWELEIRLEVADADPEAVRAAVAHAGEARLGLRSIVEVVPAESLPRFELKAQRFRIRRD